MFPNFQQTRQYNPYDPYNNQFNQFNQYQGQYNQYSQPTLEFKRNEQDIDIKFFRLHPTTLDIINSPLNGLYHPLEAKEEEPNLENKFLNFDISPLYNIDNLLILNPSFGRIYMNETLEGLITFYNKSDHIIQIKAIEVIFEVEGSKTKDNKKGNKLNINVPKDTFIQKKSVYSVKFSQKIDSIGKYVIEINITSRSDFYDEQYKNSPQKYNFKKKAKGYKIENDRIEFYDNKRLTFDANLPFTVEKKFYHYQMEIAYGEIKIINNTIYPLTIADISLIPTSKTDFKFKPVDELKQLYVNQYRNKPINESKDYNCNDFFMTKYLTLQQDEETINVFKIEFNNEFIEENTFLLSIKWLNLFDGDIKENFYEIKNDLVMYNPYFKIKVVEKPENKIIINQNFKIMLKLESKNVKKKLFVSLERETKADQDKINEREFEIIDIIEKRIELSQKYPSNNFILICKSDYTGNVNMPKLKFSINEENKNKDEIKCGTLMRFNCISSNE